MMKRAHIVGGGNPPRGAYIYEAMESADYLICADSGADALWKQGLMPHVVCGDMDSISGEARRHFQDRGVLFQTFPVRKDQTDTELALDLALKAGCRMVELSGMDGGRIDHWLVNYLLGARYGRRCRMSFLGDRHRVWVVTDHLELDGRKGQTLSVIPLVQCRGVSLTGFSYPLTEATLDFGSSLGISNVVEDDAARVSLEEGLALVVCNW